MHGGLLRIALVPSVMTKIQTRQKSTGQYSVIHISSTVRLIVMKFGMGMYLDAFWVDLEYQGHGSKVKVTTSKNVILGHWNVILVHYSLPERE